MLVTNHVLAGALIGHVAPGPVSAFVAGVVSHFAMDVVPHWGDRPIETVLPLAVGDGLTGLTVIAWAARTAPPGRRLTVLAAMAGASIPDLDKPSSVFFGVSPFPRAWDAFHARIQTESSRRLPQEFIVGAVLAALLQRRNQASKAPVS